jgi:polysaccharide biosynthesis transport protein
VAEADLKQLNNDLDAKRQLYVAFLSQAGQVRIAAEQIPTAHVLFQAVPPEKPLHAFGMISLMLGFVGGVAGAAGIVVLRSNFSLRINSSDEMELATGLPVFGMLPDFKPLSLAAPQTAAPVTETLRALWLRLRSQQTEGRAIVVTSSEVEEGKTTVAVALAHTFTDDGCRVLLIDADLRRPRLSAGLASGPIKGLEAVLSGEVAFEQAVQPVKAGLDCLLTDGSVANPMKALSSDQFRQFLAMSKRLYDFVILDSPPVLHVADPVLLASLCQHVVFVVQAGRLSSELVAEATRRFAAEDRTKMITLLTRVRHSRIDTRGYYRGYASSGGILRMTSTP